MNYYDILGVAKTATPDELKTAYRKMVKQYHPDLGGTDEMIKKINEAYDTLSDPHKRAAYDYEQNRPGFGTGFNPEYRSSPFTFDDEIMQHFGTDFFHIFTGQGNVKPKNKNIRVKLVLDFLSTLHEQEKIIDIKLTHGKETITVKIPAGVEDGASFTMRGKGDNEHQNIPRGNLEIIIEVKSHDRFIRQGQNILTEVTIDCFDAILGTEILLSTPSQRNLSINIPAGTQSGTVFGISDEGFPTYPKFTRGKLLVRINVKVPQNLTKEQINLVHEIQKIKPINT